MDIMELEEKQRENRCEILIQNIKGGNFDNLEEAKELVKMYRKEKELKEAIKKGKKSKFEYLLNRIKEGKVSESDRIKTKELAEEYKEIKRFNEAISTGKQKVIKEKQADIELFKRKIQRIKQADFTEMETAKHLSKRYGKSKEFTSSIIEGLEKLKELFGFSKFDYFYGLCDIEGLKIRADDLRNYYKKTKEGCSWAFPLKELEVIKYYGCIDNGYKIKDFFNKICKKENIFLRFWYKQEKKELDCCLWDWILNKQIRVKD